MKSYYRNSIDDCCKKIEFSNGEKEMWQVMHRSHMFANGPADVVVTPVAFYPQSGLIRCLGEDGSTVMINEFEKDLYWLF